MKGEGLSGFSLGVLRVLVNLPLASQKNGGGISAQAIAQLINEDEYVALGSARKLAVVLTARRNRRTLLQSLSFQLPPLVKSANCHFLAG